MATLDLVLTEFILLAIVCFFLLRYFKDPAVTFDVTISVYFSWVLGFVGILLLPYDLSVAIVENTHSTMLAVVWKFIYWRLVCSFLTCASALTVEQHIFAGVGHFANANGVSQFWTFHFLRKGRSNVFARFREQLIFWNVCSFWTR